MILSFNAIFALDVQEREKVSPFSPLLAGGGACLWLRGKSQVVCWWFVGEAAERGWWLVSGRYVYMGLGLVAGCLGTVVVGYTGG